MSYRKNHYNQFIWQESCEYIRFKVFTLDLKSPEGGCEKKTQLTVNRMSAEIKTE